MKNHNLNVKKVLEEFRKSESSPAHHKGTFKLEAPFEKALDTILKAKPKPNPPNSKLKRS